MEPDDDTPQSRCPICKEWQDDLDGFGVMKCERCSYCQHPTETGTPDGKWTCDLCGRATPG